MKVKIIDTLPEIGGQLAALYPEKNIYDVPGRSEVKAKDLIKNLHKQMKQFDDKIDIVLNETVEYVKKRYDEDVFEICTNKLCHFSKTVLITAGKGAFQPRKLGVTNEEMIENLHYSVTNMKTFHDKRVAIFGGGDSAVDWANMLSEFTKEVSIIHRRNQFRAHEHSVELMKENGVNIFTPYVIKDYIGQSEIDKVIIENSNTKEVKELEVDEVVVLFGYQSKLGPISEWDLEIDSNSLVVNSAQESSIHGIFAAGDACVYDGKIKMITSGFGEAATAVNSAYQYINPESKNKVVFSSALMKK